jgi:GT2 family glycosyltransferase
MTTVFDVTVTVIIVNYNGEPYLARCLNAVSIQALCPRQVVLVGNASADGGADRLQKTFPWLRVIRFNPDYRMTPIVRGVRDLRSYS